MDATILGLSFSRNVIFYERLQGDATTVQRLGQRLVKGMPILEDYFKSVFIRKMTEPTIIKCKKNYFRKVMGTMAKTKQEKLHAIIKLGNI